MKSENQKNSQKQENRIAGAFSGRKTPASGAMWYRKGDVRTDDLLIEAKHTTNKTQISLKSKDLDKIQTEALLDGRMGVLMFHLNGQDYACLSESDFYWLINLIRSLKDGSGL